MGETEDLQPFLAEKISKSLVSLVPPTTYGWGCRHAVLPKGEMMRKFEGVFPDKYSEMPLITDF